MENILRNFVNTILKIIVPLTCKKSPDDSVLIIKLEVLGDFILFLPSLKHYKEFYNDKKITLLVDSGLNKKIAERYKEKGLIDEIIILDSSKFSKNIFYRFSFSRILYKTGFKTSIYHTYYRRFLGDFLVDITNATERIGFTGYRVEKYNDKRMLNVYTKTISVPKEIKTEFDRNKYFIESITEKDNIDYRPEFPISKEDENYDLKKPYAVIFPGAGQEYRNWSAKRFSEICEYLIKKNITPVITGSSVDKEPVEVLINHLPKDSAEKIINLSEKTNIFELAYVLKNAKFYFGNETGIVHLAIAVECPTLCILGGGVFDIFYPYGDLNKNRAIYWKDMPCKNDDWECRKQNPNGPAPCINAITTDQAKSEIDNLLEYLK